MDNLRIYNAVRTAPKEALTPISAGRLKGKSDISPIWRIKALTELFGPVGIGWRVEVLDQRIVDGANDEKACFVDLNLYVKLDGEWSAPIPGQGGSMFVVKESKGLYTDDECFKKAYTDALSVACKALGVAADVYWSSDPTKYSARPTTDAPTTDSKIDNNRAMELANLMIDKVGRDRAAVTFTQITGYASTKDVPSAEFETAKGKIIAFGQPAEEAYLCVACRAGIDKATRDESINLYGMSLCKTCMAARASGD